MTGKGSLESIKKIGIVVCTTTWRSGTKWQVNHFPLSPPHNAHPSPHNPHPPSQAQLNNDQPPPNGRVDR